MTLAQRSKQAAAGAGAGGGAEFYVGSFTKNNATGTQAITGVGFTPKAIVFWTSGSAAASGTWDATIFQSIGFTSGAAESFCVNGSSLDGTGISNTGRRISSKALTFVLYDGATDLAEADLQSFDVDGFTLDWTLNEAVHTGGAEINFLAIGGAGVEAKVVNWTSPTSATTKAVTGVGFQPDVVLHANHGGLTSMPESGAQHRVAFGAMDAAGGQWFNSVDARDAQGTSDTSRYQRIDKAIGYHATSSGAVVEEAAFSSMDADGFTLNFTTAVAVAYQYVSLCLSGVDAKVGSLTKTTSAAPASQAVTGVGFEPAAVLLSTVSATASTTVGSDARWALGAGDGSSERLAAQNDQDAVSPTNADSLWVNTKAIATHAATVNSEADLSSLDADGFTLNWTTNNASAFQILYLALA